MPDTEAISLIQDSGPVEVTPSAMGVMPAVRSVLSFGDTTESAPNAVQPQGQDPYQIQQPYFMPPYRPMATIPDYQLSGIYQQTSTNTTVPSINFSFNLPFLQWEGMWNSARTYDQFAVVQFNISTYMALTANVNKQPDLNPTIWVLLSKNLNFRGKFATDPLINFGQSITGTLIFTPTWASTAGNLYVVTVYDQSANSTSQSYSISDLAGNTYHPVTAPVINTGLQNAVAMFYAYNIAGASPSTNTISGSRSPSGGSNFLMTVAEYTGIAASVNPLVSGNSNFNTLSTSSGSIAVTLTSSGSSDLVVLSPMVNATNTNTTHTQPSGFVARKSNYPQFYDDSARTATLTSPYTTSFTSVGTLVASVVAGGSFRPETSGGFFVPFDVVEYLGSMYVCISETNSNPLAAPSSWVLLAQGTGNVSAKTSNYTAIDSDYGSLLSVNSSGAVAITLPATPPEVSWWIAVESIGTGTTTIAHNGRNIDGVASDLTLNQNNGLFIFTDGTNYFTCRGLTSLSLTMPAEFVVSGSPGAAITVTKANESANTAWMGPTSGAAAAPTFRQPQDLDLSLADITTNNVSTTAHGFAPKLPNDSTKFLNGIGTYTVPAGGGGGGSAGGVNAQTSNYTAVSGDNGKLITFNSASAVTLTLPNPTISSTWWISVQNVGAGVLTVNPNSLNLDGSSNSILVPQNQGLAIFTDSTNYFTDRGYGGGLIAKVDITGRTNAIGTTTFSNTGTGLQAGMYCVYGYLDITTAASSGTISITISYTDDSGSDSQTTTGVAVGALHDNGGFAIPLFSTANNTISYATTFNSVIGTPTYAIHLWLVAIPGTPISASFGGVNSQTADYTAVAADSGKLLSFNKATAVNLTLPSSPPSSNWYINVENRGAGILNILRNGLTIDGANLSFYLKQNQGCNIYTDGSNYFLQMRDTGIPRPNTRRTANFLATGATGSGSGNTITTTGPSGVLSMQGETAFSGGSWAGSVATTGNPSSVSFTSGAVNNTGSGEIAGTLQYLPGINIRFQCYAKINNFASGRFWFGMDTGNMGGSANPAGNYAVFRADKSVPDTNFQCITKDGTTQTITDSGIAIDTNWHRFEVIFNDNLATPNVQFFIDGTLVATNTTHLPSTGTALAADLTCVSTASATRQFSFAWMYIESDL